MKEMKKNYVLQFICNMHLKLFIFLLCAIVVNTASIKPNQEFGIESCLNEFVDENGQFSLKGIHGGLEGTGRCLKGHKDESKCKLDDIQISYNFFSREGEFENSISYLPQCPYPTTEVKIIIHGWQSDPTKPWLGEFKNAYLKKGNNYVITIDWSQVAKRCQFFNSAANTQCVGYKLGDFILTYFTECNVTLKNVHIIGHSLGAHVAGFAGKYVLKTANEQIGRVSGLDPSRPCFEETDQESRLSQDDAIIVDVYHTDHLLALSEAIGDFDFFINGGLRPQPGCLSDKQNIGDMVSAAALCSHERAYECFTESIFDKFIASKCTRKDTGFVVDGPDVLMGENINAKIPGSYCIKTNDKSPFSKTA